MLILRVYFQVGLLILVNIMIGGKLSKGQTPSHYFTVSLIPMKVGVKDSLEKMRKEFMSDKEDFASNTFHQLIQSLIFNRTHFDDINSNDYFQNDFLYGDGKLYKSKNEYLIKTYFIINENILKSVLASTRAEQILQLKDEDFILSLYGHMSYFQCAPGFGEYWFLSPEILLENRLVDTLIGMSGSLQSFLSADLDYFEEVKYFGSPYEELDDGGIPLGVYKRYLRVEKTSEILDSLNSLPLSTMKDFSFQISILKNILQKHLDGEIDLICKFTNRI